MLEKAHEWMQEVNADPDDPIASEACAWVDVIGK